MRNTHRALCNSSGCIYTLCKGTWHDESNAAGEAIHFIMAAVHGTDVLQSTHGACPTAKQKEFWRMPCNTSNTESGSVGVVTAGASQWVNASLIVVAAQAGSAMAQLQAWLI